MYIGNLHVQHLQSVMMMFEAGKPVLCEKPMTTSVKKATTMIQAARDKGIFLMEVRIDYSYSHRLCWLIREHLNHNLL